MRHGSANYCGRCVLALAWGEVILQAQRPSDKAPQPDDTEQRDSAASV